MAANTPDPKWNGATWTRLDDPTGVEPKQKVPTQITFRYAGTGDKYTVDIHGDRFSATISATLETAHNVMHGTHRGGFVDFRWPASGPSVMSAMDPDKIAGYYRGGPAIGPPVPPPPPPPRPPSPIPIHPPPPKNICGPHIDYHLEQALDRLRRRFERGPMSTQVQLCEAMINPVRYTLSDDWDINELYKAESSIRHYGQTPLKKDAGGIFRDDYGCALGDGEEDKLNQSEGCDTTVQVRGHCHRSRSVNYVAYGLMWKLCYDFNEELLHGKKTLDEATRRSLPNPYRVTNRFTEKLMLFFIWFYKMRHINKQEAMAWASAGYHGWPNAPTPAPDMTQCKSCAKYYNQPFTMRWGPVTTFP